MVVVAIFSAYIAMRVAIHGREVEVPQQPICPLSEAAAKAAALGLRFNIENRFYSAVPAGEVISQSPAPGTTVRREWTHPRHRKPRPPADLHPLLPRPDRATRHHRHPPPLARSRRRGPHPRPRPRRNHPRPDSRAQRHRNLRHRQPSRHGLLLSAPLPNTKPNPGPRSPRPPQNHRAAPQQMTRSLPLDSSCRH